MTHTIKYELNCNILKIIVVECTKSTIINITFIDIFLYCVSLSKIIEHMSQEEQFSNHI